MNYEFNDSCEDLKKELELFIGDSNLDEDNEESLSNNYFKKPFKKRLNLRLKNKKKVNFKKANKRKLSYLRS